MPDHASSTLPRAILVFLGFCASSASAHTGQNFFLVEDASLTAPGSVQTGSSFEWTHADRTDSFGFEPSVTAGLTPWLALEFQSSFANEGSGWRFQSALPSLQLSPDASGWDLPVRFLFSAGYQLADGAAGHVHTVTHVHTVPAGPPVDLGPDAPPPTPAGTTVTHVHTHGSDSTSVIHLHGINALTSHLALEANPFSHTQVAFNLIAVQPESRQLSWAAGFGLRHQLSPEWSVGAEFIGDLGSGGQQLLLGTVGWQPSHHLGLRLGVGGGLTDSSPDATVRTAFSWAF